MDRVSHRLGQLRQHTHTHQALTVIHLSFESTQQINIITTIIIIITVYKHMDKTRWRIVDAKTTEIRKN